MRRLDFNKEKDKLFIKQYLYAKLKHVDRYNFYLNFSDISQDLRPYIEANYFDYININYEDLSELTIDEKSLKNLNMLHRNYINRYTWVFREQLLDILKEESKEDFKLNAARKSWFIDKGMKENDVAKITNSFLEWKTAKSLTMPNDKDCENEVLAKNVFNDIAKKIVELNLNDDIGIDYNFNLTVKTKKKKNYFSGRAYSGIALTKNDLEEKYKNEWDKETKDGRLNRSEFFDCLKNKGYFIIDLGDMSSNFPNILNCIKTGIYEDLDFHSKVAAENNISRSIAKMAAVRCCFNCRKVDILYGLLDKADLSKLANEIKEMEESGIFVIKDNKVSLKKGRKIKEAHEFFNDNKDNKFFSYCNDFLTSWDVCHEVYKNELAPSDLSLLTSAVEINVIYDAYKKGLKIVNAYDHAYLITKNENDYYDWKGEYKKWAEEVVKYYNKDVSEFNGRSRKSIVHIGDHRTEKKSVLKIGMKNALKTEIRNYLKENNYDIEKAAAKYNWKPQWKYYWKKLIKEGKI